MGVYKAQVLTRVMTTSLLVWTLVGKDSVNGKGYTCPYQGQQINSVFRLSSGHTYADLYLCGNDGALLMDVGKQNQQRIMIWS